MLEKNITHRPPEIPPVGSKGMLVVGIDIAFFGGLDIFQGLRRCLVVIERGQEPWLHADMQLLHLRRVHIEILTAQRADAHQFHLPLEDVDAHRKLVDPGFPEKASPEVHPVIIGKFPALLQSLMLQHIGLEIFGIAVHRPELIDANDIAFITHPRKFDETSARGFIVPYRILHFLAQ